MTQLQRRAVTSRTVNLSDAHARHSLRPTSRNALAEAFEAALAGPGSWPELAEFFTAGLARHTGQAYPVAATEVVYSASIALVVAARYLRGTARGTVGVITPTVDCVPAQFIGAGLPVTAVPERLLMPRCALDRLDRLGLGALVVVTPNNPTGGRLAETELTRLIEWSARRRVTLILDMSFRMHDPGAQWDVIATADDIGADVIVVDDTGKTLSLEGVKLGVMSATKGVRVEVSRLCSDIMLAAPQLNLLLLGTLLEETGQRAEVTATRELSRRNAAHLAERLREGGRQIASGSRWAACGADDGADDGAVSGPGGAYRPSVAWVPLGAFRDRVLEGCAERGLTVVPGDHFYWGGDETGDGAHHVRVALLRDVEYFARGVDLLAAAIAGAGRVRG